MLPANMSVSVSSSSTRPSWCALSTSRMSRQMLSAVPGSLSSRYCLAFSIAPGMPAFVSGLSSKSMRALERRCARSLPETARAAPLLAAEQRREQPLQRIVEAVDDALLQRNDRVVGDRDVLGADDRAALRDVAEADAVRFLELGEAVLGVERVHLERGGVHEEARADELVVLLVFAQHVADVLAQEALDALPELLHPVDVLLLHAPRAVLRVGRARLERLDALLHREVPRHVGDEVLDRRERLQRLQRDRLLEGDVRAARHAHETRVAVDLRRARTALAGLAVPAHREVGRRLGLHLVHGVEHDHALADLRAVVAVLAAVL